MKQLDNIIEDIAQLGCLEVNQIIRQLDAGGTPSIMSELQSEEQKYIHSELKSVMAIYDDGVCSI